VAIVVTGIALYLSRGVLDQVADGDRLTRVALLPPWQALAGFAALAAIGLIGLARQVAPGARQKAGVTLADATLPLLGLALLFLPYLPVLPDTVPAVQILAGPLRAILWLLVLSQLAWVVWQGRPEPGARSASPWSTSRLAVLVGIVSAFISAVAASRVTGTVLAPAGDEPHYLVMAQSLWRDGDLKIENNHARGDYKEYFAPELEPHFVTRGADQEIYSIHPVGLPFLLAPVYAMGGYPAVVATMVLMAAAALALVWTMVATSTRERAPAVFAWASIAATAPFLFNSYTVYPEIAAALAVAVAYVRLAGPAGRPWPSWLLVGLMAATLPWLSTKYSPMSAAVVLVALARVVLPGMAGASSPAAWVRGALTGRAAGPALAILVPYLLSLAGWFAFFEAIWGSPWPQAPYGALVQTQVGNLVFGAPGLLVDQEYGLLPYAPVYLLAAAGLLQMWRSGGEDARRAVEILCIGGVLLATVGAFRIWWGGTAAPGRPIASALPLLMLPIAVAYQSARRGSAARAASQLLLWSSIGIAGVMLFAQNGFLILNGRDGTSSLLEFLSPQWALWTAAPSFILHEPPTALARTAVWIAIACGATFLLMRLRWTSPGAASIAALGVIVAAVASGLGIASNLPASPDWPAIDVRARARAPILQEYDAVARPIGVQYAPLRFTSAADVSRQVVLEVRPGSRTEPQPLRVLHNGRFSLPAGGYQLDIDWSGSRSGESIGLQLGRTGEPWQEWAVEPRAGERFSVPFTLPVDVGFVGLRGSPDLERVIARIAFVPMAVVDRARRPRTPAVMAASKTPGADFFFADENALVEKSGFWVRGRRSTAVVVQRASAGGPLRLRVNSGLIQNRLRISAAGWSRTIAIQPRLPEEIEVPVDNRSLVTLNLTADMEFVPKDLDPASNDPRPLGIWVEVMR
jgi:hypothetical protein